MKFGLFGAVLSCLFFSTTSGFAAQQFDKGDRVAFIGDSITHGGSYHSNVYLFYALRKPDAFFSVYNCGISGDTTPGTNQRFDIDIAVHKPNCATIMLGMNDAWTWLFDGSQTPENQKKFSDNAYKLYEQEFRILLNKLSALNCDVTLITPSIYDQTADLKTKNLVGKNDQLQRYSDLIQKLGDKFDVIDFQNPMLKINEKLQSQNPSATIVGQDRVHPGAAGHFVMSYEFLKTQGFDEVVSSIEIDADSEKFDVKNASIKNAKFDGEKIEFHCVENALPFPVLGDQKIALDWVPFQKELNQQTLKITGLNSGEYELKIDGENIGTFAAEDFAKGINLAENQNTPQYKQSLLVKSINDERLQVVAKARSVMHVRHTMLSKLDKNIDLMNVETLRPILMKHVDAAKGKPWYGYMKSQAEGYLANVENEANFYKDAEKLMQKMWQINQPKPHLWVISPVKKDR